MHHKIAVVEVRVGYFELRGFVLYGIVQKYIDIDGSGPPFLGSISA